MMLRPSGRTFRAALAYFALIALAACGAVDIGDTARGDSQADVVERTLSKVVKIFGAGGIHNLEAYGTGILVSAGGHVVTVGSHLIDAGDVNVVLNDGRRFTGKVVKVDPKLDLAVLKIEGEERDLPFFDLKDVAEVRPGTRVLGFSNMFKVATGDEPVSVVHGVVATRTKLSARRGAFGASYEGPVYVVDAVTNNPGAAGGALTTIDGRLIGLIGREVRNAESNTWVNYAVSMRDLRGTIDEMIAGRFTATPSRPPDSKESQVALRDLGLLMVPDVVYRTPAYVETVLPDSPAAKAGIAPEDLIVFVNDELVQSNRALKAILSKLEAGDALRIVVRRKEQLVPLDLRVPDRRRK